MVSYETGRLTWSERDNVKVSVSAQTVHYYYLLRCTYYGERYTHVTEVSYTLKVLTLSQIIR